MAYYTGGTGSTVRSSYSYKKPMVGGALGGNLTDQGYPDSKAGYYGTSTNTTPKYTGSGSGSGSGSGNNNNSALYNALLASYRGVDDSYYNQMRALAQDAYNRGMSALNSAYDTQMSSLDKNLSSTKNQLQKNYDFSKGNIMDDSHNSLRQAYVNKMLSHRNLAQQLSAQGLSGGATETTLAGMQNNYGNARNNINTTTNRNLKDLENNYADNVSNASQAYNSAVAQANMQKAQQALQLENALAGNQISALSDYQSLMQRDNQNYLDLLKSALSNAKGFTFDPTTVTNLNRGINLTQATQPDNGSNYNALLASGLIGNSNNASASPNALAGQSDNSNYLAAILRQLAG